MVKIPNKLLRKQVEPGDLLGERGDVVARVRGYEDEFGGREKQQGKSGSVQMLKHFKLDDDFISLGLRRGASADDWLVFAIVEAATDKKASYGSVHFSGYIAALDYFESVVKEYGLASSAGSDYGSD